MRVLIVGAGVSGITSAINVKRTYPNDDVLVIEHLDKPLKKILATGNGKCNFGNAALDINRYSNPLFVEPILKEYDFKKQMDFYDSISIKYKLFGELAYPMSESAVSVRNALLNECKKLGIKINLSESIIDYKVGKEIEVKTDKNIYKVDKLVFAAGGCSQKNLGSDGSVFTLLKKHGYDIVPPLPGLCPIKTKERMKVLDGVRAKSLVSLYKDGKLIHEEAGEVLFRDHGLSGIVIMNISSFIARDLNKKYEIQIDQLPDTSIEELKKYLSDKGKEMYLQSLFHPKMIEYIQNNLLEPIKASKELSFHFEELDSFEHSQVTIGGLNVKEATDKLESKKEKNVYFLGEMLNIDGPCGGYNLMWAVGSALYVK
ncbi:MAG: aminoacetone oxidase family FAD-binding enzyme [Bacilli bacterium]|nr:aminoacetone oxidase family FAD-binding enzyme [Bacilli bacterium]